LAISRIIINPSPVIIAITYASMRNSGFAIEEFYFAIVGDF
jgi:hypothetical protein